MVQVGARGADEQGAIFASSLKRSSVDVRKLRVGKGITGRACPTWSSCHAFKSMMMSMRLALSS